MNGFRTIVSACVVLVIEVARLLGLDLSGDDTQTLESVFSIIGLGLVIWFRISATVIYNIK